MVITQLELENFKSFLTRQTLPLAPITLLYGPNGGGKSSVIQALLALRQTFRQGRGGLVTDGEDVQLGGFANAVSCHDTDRKIGIGFKRPAKQDPDQVPAHSIYLRYGRVPDDIMDDAAVKEMTISWDGETPGRSTAILAPCDHVPRVDVQAVNWSMIRDGHPPFSLPQERLYRIVDSMASLIPLFLHQSGVHINPTEIAQLMANLPFESHFVRLNELGIPGVLYDSTIGAWVPAQPGAIHMGGPQRPDVHPLMNDLGVLWADMTEESGSAFSDLVHIEPLRQMPARFYTYNDLLLSAANDKFRRQKHWANVLREFREIFPGLCSKYLSDFGVPYNIRIEEVDLLGSPGLYQILLDDQKTGATVTLADVGFGVSQLLPILAHGMSLLGSSKVVLVQQPELHLHPRLQAHLADFFIDTCCSHHARPSVGYDAFHAMQSQWIIETHSEALITRMQRRIREKRIRAEDVSVLYLDRIEDRGTVVTPLRLNSDGDFIDEWPGGFFEDGFDDLFGIDR